MKYTCPRSHGQGLDGDRIRAHYVFGLQNPPDYTDSFLSPQFHSGPVTARVDFRGCYYIRFLAGLVLRSLISAVPVPTAQGARDHSADEGAPGGRCGRPCAALCSCGALRRGRWVANAPRASRPIGVTVVTPGRARLPGPALALLRHLLGTCCVVVTPLPPSPTTRTRVCRGGPSLRPPGAGHTAGRRRARGPPASPCTP